MKKYKQLIIGILIGVLVSSGTIYAFTISSSEVTYTTKTGTETTVDKELDNLYEVYSYGTATSNDLLTGKTAYSNGTKLLGTLPKPTAVTGNAYSGDAGFLNGTGALTTSTSLNLSNYKNNNQYSFNLGGGEQVTFPSGYYDLPINVSNGVTIAGSATLNYKPIVSVTNWNSGSAGGSWTADKDYPGARFIVVSGTNSSRSVTLTVAGVNVGLSGIGSTGYTKSGDTRISNIVDVKAGDVITANTSGSESRVDCYCTMIYVE